MEVIEIDLTSVLSFCLTVQILMDPLCLNSATQQTSRISQGARKLFGSMNKQLPATKDTD
jgi:hypothetical protein